MSGVESGIESWAVPTEVGPGRLDLHAAAADDDAGTVLLLSHGAGNGVEARDLAALAEALPAQGVSVALFEQPWRVAGRKIATAPSSLDVGLRAAAASLRAREARWSTADLVVGGRSAGARSAARCARDLGAAGCLALAFPLHPPGRPERSRYAELAGAGVPTLVVQGERDAMGSPDELVAARGDDDGADGFDLSVVPFADHGMRVPARAPIGQDDALGVVVESALEWLLRNSRPTSSR